ncbi:hypothetical protein [Streptomyces boluensis]|uniref:Uncharacterized protein n=1 Tax=Streptomyces boluensis TaxID=1775135 RepID=A0A964UQM6_9ACTN|nr:hypothetical protein [Streptomyces boluensis]NBE52711.1 hypothetical protein [Streptomyces boluensis]
MKRRTTVLTAAVLGALSVTVPAQAAEGGVTLVRTGDIDLLEDVLEHISVSDGRGGRTVHQMYDSKAGAAG